MKRTVAFIILGITLLTTSCGKSEKSTEEINKELYRQVMDVHDEMMPSMEDLYKMKKKLRGQIAAADTLGQDKNQFEANLSLVDSASNVMMVWMREFKPEDLEGEELTTYLKSELEKVNDMKKAIESALEKKAEVLGQEANLPNYTQQYHYGQERTSSSYSRWPRRQNYSFRWLQHARALFIRH